MKIDNVAIEMNERLNKKKKRLKKENACTTTIEKAI